MSLISVDTEALKDIEKKFGTLSQIIGQTESNLKSIRSNLDSDIKKQKRYRQQTAKPNQRIGWRREGFEPSKAIFKQNNKAVSGSWEIDAKQSKRNKRRY